MAKILDGSRLAKRMQAEIKRQVAVLGLQGVHPCLATVLVGEQAASERYLASQLSVAKRLGVAVRDIRVAGSVSQLALIERIHELNNDRGIHGIIVQLPLPAHVDTLAILRAIAADKDVDCLNPAHSDFLSPPCTPAAIMEIIRRYRIPVVGKEAVIVGASDIVGKPLAKLLIEAEATVTVCHIKTKALIQHTRRADILVVAIGSPERITGRHIKSGASVIDVGINRRDGRLVGDVHFLSASRRAAAITPVPGGVGPVTTTTLFVHVVKAAARASGI